MITRRLQRSGPESLSPWFVLGKRLKRAGQTPDVLCRDDDAVSTVRDDLLVPAFATGDDSALTATVPVDDATTLLRAAGLQLTPAQVAVLHVRTEGWAAGLRLASNVLPSGYRSRVVLLSDGQETAGDAVAQARLLQARGVEVDAVGREEKRGEHERRLDPQQEAWVAGAIGATVRGMSVDRTVGAVDLL